MRVRAARLQYHKSNMFHLVKNTVERFDPATLVAAREHTEIQSTRFPAAACILLT